MGRLAALPEALEPLSRPFYFVALLLIFVPALDFWTTVSPTHWDQIRWRFGMIGILGGFITTPLFGAVVLMAMAAMMEHRRVQLAVAFLNLLIALIMVAALGLFVLDTIQIRGEIGASSVSSFDAVAYRTGGKLLLAMVTYLWLARAGVKSYRATSLPEGWQPGDPVPIVNTETVNVEGMGEPSLTAERVSREMLIGTDAVNVEGVQLEERPALARDMLLTPSSVPAQPPVTRKSDGLRPDELVTTSTVRVSGAAPVEPKRVTKDMLIVS